MDAKIKSMIMAKTFIKLSSAAILLITLSMCAQNGKKGSDDVQEKELQEALIAENETKTDTTMYNSDNGKKGIVLDSIASNGTRLVEFVPTGVCSSLIHIEMDKAGKIQNVVFTNGCDGNAKGIGALIKGMDVKEAIKRLEGIKCGSKCTSCPDQLSIALKEALSAVK